MLSLVCVNISHLVSGFCPGQCHRVKPTKRLAASPHYIHDIFMFPTVLYIADVVGGDLPATGNWDYLY